MMAGVAACWFLVVCLCASVCGQDLGTGTCAGAAGSAVVVGPDAAAVISTLIGFSDPGQGAYGCGEPDVSSVPAYEALLWALSLINQESGIINGEAVTESYVPGIKIGLHVQDTCERSALATAAVLDRFPQLAASSDSCSPGTTPTLTLGVLGASVSNVSGAVNVVLGDAGVPQISYASSVPSLSDTVTYPTFLRTVPTDQLQIQVILELLVSLEWTRLAVVYTDDDYGRETYASVRTAAYNMGLCLHKALRIPAGETDTQRLQDVLGELVAAEAVAVVYLGSAQEARGLLQVGLMVEDAGSLQWVLPASVGTSMSVVEGLNYARGILAIAPASRHISEFEDYWVRLDETSPPTEDPWFQAWYMSQERCRLPGVTEQPYGSYADCVLLTEAEKRATYQQDQYVEPALTALYTYARALRNARADLCGASTSGVCDNLLSMSSQTFTDNYIRPTDFTFGNAERISSLASSNVPPHYSPKRVSFDDNGDLVSTGFDVWNFNDVTGTFSFQKVGSFLDGGVLDVDVGDVYFYDSARLTVLDSIPSSSCPSTGCGDCISGPASDLRHAYIAGDLVVGGVFSVHQSGTTPLSCGPIDTLGDIQLVQAFIYALIQVAAMQEILPNIDLGALILDGCSSDQLAANALTNFLTGSVVYDDDGEAIEPVLLKVLIGGGNDYITSALGDVTNSIQIPQVAFHSGRDMLSSQSSLMSQTPADESQLVAAVLAVVATLGYTRAQLVHQGDQFAQHFQEDLISQAILEGICIDDRTDIAGEFSYSEWVASWDNDTSRVIVFKGDADAAVQLLSEVTKLENAAEFVVIWTGVSWDIEVHLRTTLSTLAMTLLTVEPASPGQPAYESYLMTLTPETVTENPWFEDWYQSAFNCYINPDSPSGYPAQCASSPMLPITSAAGFRLHPTSVYVIDAVWAAAYGLHATLVQYCGVDYQAVCANFTSAPDRSLQLTQNIQAASFTDATGSTFHFLGDSGARGLDVNIYDSGQFNKIGSYSVESSELSLDVSSLAVSGESSTCSPPCSACMYMYSMQPHLVVQGDITLALLVDVHQAGPQPFSCGDMHLTRGFLYTEAFRYAIQQVNTGAAPVSLNGVTLGGVGLDACSSSLRANNLLTSLYSGALAINGVTIDEITGWLSAGDTLSAEINDVMAQLATPHVSTYTAAPAHMDLMRTVSSGDALCSGIVQFLTYMNWKYVHVIFSNDLYGAQLYQLFEAEIQASDICLISSHEVDYDSVSELADTLVLDDSPVLIVIASRMTLYGIIAELGTLGTNGVAPVVVSSQPWDNNVDIGQLDNMLVFDIDYQNVADFDTYMSTMSATPDDRSGNPWLQEYYEDLFQCNLGPRLRYDQACANTASLAVTEAAVYSPDSTVATTITAVYAYTEALHQTLQDLCGPNYTGICREFTESQVASIIQEKLAQVQFQETSGSSVSFQNGIYESGFTISRLNAASRVQVGHFTGSSLYVTDPSLPDLYDYGLTCGTSCQSCIDTTEHEQANYIHGDILIGGLFDVHSPGSSPFNCGFMDDTEGSQLLEAFNFAIDYINQHLGTFSNKLLGLTVGGLALDSCRSATRSTNVISNVHSGVLGFEVDGREVDPGRLQVYVGGLRNDVTAAAADTLGLYGIPLVSYGATALSLGDITTYPYFLRVVPSDNKQAEAMVAFLEELRLDYVQVVVSPSQGTAADAFTNVASLSSICVAQRLELPNNPSLEEARRITQLLLFKPTATMIVLFIEPGDIETLLEAVQATPELDTFSFVGSTTWADSESALTSLSRPLAAVTLVPQRTDVTSFAIYLEDLSPATYGRNPWFREYYELAMQCSLSPDSDAPGEQCSDDTTPISRAPGYQQEIHVPYVINAVLAAAVGLHYALQELCGPNYFGICQEYHSSPERRQLILEGMQEAMFDDVMGQPFHFTVDGSGPSGYHLYMLRQASASDAFYYDNIGSFTDESGLTLPSNLDLSWSSSCGNEGCVECPVLGPIRTRHIVQPSSENLNLVVLVDAHFQSPSDPLQCGDLDTARGFQQVLALLYALQLINANPALQLAPTIKLGAFVIDTCSNDARVTQDVLSLLLGNDLDAVPHDQHLDMSTVLAFIPFGSSNTAAASRILTSQGITTLSPSASADDLGGMPYFLRTVQSDTSQARVLAEIVSSFNWGYISVVYSADELGNLLQDTFMQESSQVNVRSPICIAGRASITVGADLLEAQQVLRTLDSVHGANIVVLFTNQAETRLLLEAAQDMGYGERFIWVGGTSWGHRMEVVQGLEEVARGAISISLWNEPYDGFLNYVTNMTLNEHDSIPDDWFEEFWQHSLQCRLDNSSNPRAEYPTSCHPNGRLSPELIEQDETVLQTIIAAHIVAQGLNDIGSCTNHPLGMAGCLSQQTASRDLLYDAFKDAQWSVLGGELDSSFQFRFDEEGSGNTGYNVYNYRIGSSGDYEYVQIGSYVSSLELDVSAYYAYDWQGRALHTYPLSQCPQFACTCLNQNSSSNTVATQTTATLDVAENLYQPWGIIVVALACVGVLSAFVALIYLVIYYPNRKGTTYLGYLLLLGVICMYSLVFAFVMHATENTCGIRRFGLAFVYALCFSCLLIKMMNNWRLDASVDHYDQTAEERIAHPCSIFFIAIFLILVQVIIGVEWLILAPSRVDIMYHEGRFVPVCAPEEFHSQELILSTLYPMMLILLTLIFSALTWDSQENHRESRWTLFTCCITVGVWLLWTVVSTMTELDYGEPAIAIALLVNATCILICLTARKIVLLVKYQKEIDDTRSHYSGSTVHDFIKDAEYYSTVHGNRAYEFDHDGPPFHQPPSPAPHMGSNNGIMYIYAPEDTVGDVEF